MPTLFDGYIYENWHIRHISYVKPILDAIRRYTYPTLRVHYDNDSGHAGPGGSTRSGHLLRQLAVRGESAASRRAASSPQAVGTDGLLDVCGFEQGSLWPASVLDGVMRGQHLEWPDCRCVRATRVRVESDQEEEIPYQLDGDPGGNLPLEITVAPERVNWWCPNSGQRIAASGTERESA